MSDEFLKHRRNTFYGHAYRFLMRIEVFAIIVGILLLLFLGYLVIYQTNYSYYASTTTGRLVQLHPLDEPVLTTPFIRRWAEIAARSALNINFSTYESQLEKAKKFFMPNAWDQYINSINNKGLLSEVKSQQLVISAIATKEANILSRRVISGRYTWRLQVPLLVETQTSGSKNYQRMVVTMTIVRVPTVDSPRNILIQHIVVR